MNSSICPQLVFPDVVDCNGRGVCDGNAQCICDHGWIGNGDFISGSPACHLNVLAVQILYGILGSVALVHLPFSIYFLSSHFRDHQRQLIALGLVLNHVAFVAFSVLKILSPHHSIGSDVALTVLFVLASVSFWNLVAPLFIGVFVSLLVRALGVSNESIHKFYYFTLGLTVLRTLTTLACLAPLFMLIDPANEQLLFALATVHYTFLAVGMIFLYFVATISISPLLKSIDTNSAAKFSEVKWKLAKVLETLKQQAFIQLPMALIFGCWLSAQRFATYQLAIAWTMAMPLMTFVMFVLTLRDENHVPASRIGRVLSFRASSSKRKADVIQAAAEDEQ